MSLVRVYCENDVHCFRFGQSATAWIDKGKKALTLGRHLPRDNSGFRKAQDKGIQLEWRELEQLDNNIQNRTSSNAMATACITAQRQTLFLADKNANLTDIELTSHPIHGHVIGVSQEKIIAKISCATFWRLYRELEKVIIY